MLNMLVLFMQKSYEGVAFGWNIGFTSVWKQASRSIAVSEFSVKTGTSGDGGETTMI